jgi:hypothetical protein
MQDLDNDTLPDLWEQAYFGSSNQGNAAPNEDYDQDGVSNKDEYIAGSNPADAASFVRVELSRVDGLMTVSVKVPEATGRLYEGYHRFYAIEKCSNLKRGLWISVPGFERNLASGVTTLYEEPPMERGVFYRTRIWLEESHLSFDADEDGLPDAWETAHFGGIRASGGLIDQDYDEDGISNLAEFITGSNPADPADFLAVDAAFSESGLVVSFLAEQPDQELYGSSERYYTLQHMESLNKAGNWRDVTGFTNILARNQLVSYIVPVQGLQDLAFYRVTAQLGN